MAKASRKTAPKEESYGEEIDTKLDKLANDGVAPEKKDEDELDNAPLYRVLPENKIPVSKKLGKLWKSRKQAGLTKMKNCGDLERWEEADRYYRNDHVLDVNQRRTDLNAGNERGVRLTTRGMETENIVFANVTSLVPAVYAKNPTIEISMDDPQYDEFGKTAEKLINAIMRMESAPGVDLKPKARRAVMDTTLTNESWFLTGYTKKEESSDNAIKEIERIAEMLATAKDQKTIKECEGKLEALERTIDLLNPSSPNVRVLRGKNVIVDTDATLKSECRWMMYDDFVSCDLLRAMFGRKNEKDEWESVFEPSHVLALSDNENTEIDGTNPGFSFLNSNGAKSYKDYGYENEDSYQRAQRVKVWYVWDKVTRRVYLFNDKDWKWPIWVWDDPYGYPDFFPLDRLNFYDDPENFYARSETMMYLDQQDGINAINNEIAKVRQFVTGKTIYNKNVIKDAKVVDAFIDGTNTKRALGIDAPPDTDLSKLFVPFVPQSAHMLNTVIFDKQRLMEAIDRVSSVTNVMRGVEYKTNTTNKAIESYESTTQTRLDEKIDAVEDVIGKVGSKLLHVCLRNMDGSTVESILGQKDAEIWEQHRQAFVDSGVKFSATIVGGSTLKPTSATKKQQAIQISQSLGQFASAAPVAILIALKVMERAFDEVVIRDEDWQMIMQSIEAQLARGQSNPQGGAEGGQEGGGDGLAKVEQLIDGLPEEAKMFLAKMIAKGTPIREAVAAVVQELKQAQGGE